MKTLTQQLDEIQDRLGINTEDADAAEQFELLLASWPWPGEELTDDEIEDYRRALRNADA